MMKMASCLADVAKKQHMTIIQNTLQLIAYLCRDRCTQKLTWKRYLFQFSTTPRRSVIKVKTGNDLRAHRFYGPQNTQPQPFVLQQFPRFWSRSYITENNLPEQETHSEVQISVYISTDKPARGFSQPLCLCFAQIMRSLLLLVYLQMAVR